MWQEFELFEVSTCELIIIKWFKMSFAMLYPESNGITLTVHITHLTSEEYEAAVNRQCTHILQINTESTDKTFLSEKY
jgi:hypothetical protein